MNKIRFFLSKTFPFLVVKISIYLNMRVFVMNSRWHLNALKIMIVGAEVSWEFYGQFNCYGHVKPVIKSTHTFPGLTYTSMRSTSTCAHTYARNWQLPFLNQRKRENQWRNVSMINLNESHMTDLWLALAIPGSAVSRGIDRAMRPSQIYTVSKYLHPRLF